MKQYEEQIRRPWWDVGLDEWLKQTLDLHLEDIPLKTTTFLIMNLLTNNEDHHQHRRERHDGVITAKVGCHLFQFLSTKIHNLIYKYKSGLSFYFTFNRFLCVMEMDAGLLNNDSALVGSSFLQSCSISYFIKFILPVIFKLDFSR